MTADNNTGNSLSDYAMAAWDRPLEAMVLSSFFSSQLDYIFFVYGLSFVLMAAQCLALPDPFRFKGARNGRFIAEAS